MCDDFYRPSSVIVKSVLPNVMTDRLSLLEGNSDVITSVSAAPRLCFEILITKRNDIWTDHNPQCGLRLTVNGLAVWVSRYRENREDFCREVLLAVSRDRGLRGYREDRETAKPQRTLYRENREQNVAVFAVPVMSRTASTATILFAVLAVPQPHTFAVYRRERKVYFCGLRGTAKHKPRDR